MSVCVCVVLGRGRPGVHEDVERRGTAEQGERQPDAHPGHRPCAAQHLDSDHIEPDDRKAKDSAFAAKAAEAHGKQPAKAVETGGRGGVSPGQAGEDHGATHEAATQPAHVGPRGQAGGTVAR